MTSVKFKILQTVFKQDRPTTYILISHGVYLNL